MDTSFITGLLLGMLAALLMNIGKGVQKQYVRIFTKGRRMLEKENRRLLIFWIIGFLMTASCTIPFSLGLKLSESPSAVSAMTGVGLIGLGFYAVYVIGEQFSRTDLIGMALVVLGTSLLAYLGGKNLEFTRDFAIWQLILAIGALIVAAAAACGLSRIYASIHGLVFGATAGMCIGLAIFLGDIALVEAGGSFSGQLGNPYPYIALFFAASATVVTQFGFLKSRAIEVVSAVNSATILTPLILEMIIYRLFPSTVQVGLMLVIITGVLFLSRGAAARISA